MAEDVSTPRITISSSPSEGDSHLESFIKSDIEIPKISLAPETKGYLSISHRRERSRSWFAIGYLIGFFVLTLVLVIMGWSQSYKPEDYKDIFLALSAFLSGPLGIIIAFYFKDKLK